MGAEALFCFTGMRKYYTTYLYFEDMLSPLENTMFVCDCQFLETTQSFSFVFFYDIFKL